MSEYLEVATPKITVERVSESDMREALMGTNGNPTYEEQFGLTSAPLGTMGGPPQPSLAELELRAKQAEARALDPNAFYDAANQPPPAAPQEQPDELEKYKKLYGDSENEKGQLRRREQELMEAFNGLMAQYEALQSQAPQPLSWQGPQVPASYPAPMYQPQGYPPPTFDPFEGLGADDDVVQVKQVKNLIDRSVVPIMAASIQQSQQAMARAAALEKQLREQAKAAAGITPFDEYRLLSKNPWLRSLDEPKRIEAIASLKKAEVVTTPAQAGQAPQQAAVTQDRIVNKVTYIEGSPRADVPDQSEAAIEAAKQRDFAQVMALPAETGERARAFRKFSQKYRLGYGEGASDLVR